MHEEHCHTYAHALLQLPVFLAVIAENITLGKLANRVPIEQPVKFAAWPILSSLDIARLANLIDRHSYLFLTAGLNLYAFGAGMVNAGLYRLTLYASDAAMLGMISILTLATGIELAKSGYFNGSKPYFSLINFASGALWFVLVALFLREHKRRAQATVLS